MSFIYLEVRLGREAQKVYYALKEQRVRCLADALRGAASGIFEIDEFLYHWEDAENIDGMMSYLFDQINYAANEHELASQAEGARRERERLAADYKAQQSAYWSERLGLTTEQVEDKQHSPSSHECPDQHLKNNSTTSDHDNTTATN